MNRSFSLIAAIAALGLAGSAQALGPEDQAGAAQPTPGAQPSTIPSTEPGMPSTMGRQADPSSPQVDPATTSQSSLSSAAQNTRLAAIVPAGMSATEACSGFRSTDECAATLHASQNLGISFTDLKAKVTGGQKLGAAIKALKPDANVKSEVRKAEDQARADVRSPQG
jgi:hypothetical protein